MEKEWKSFLADSCGQFSIFPEPSPLGGAGRAASLGRELLAACNVLQDVRLKGEVSADLARHVLARLHRSPHTTQTTDPLLMPVVHDGSEHHSVLTGFLNCASAQNCELPVDSDHVRVT